ncbi:MAG: hypothetical protein ABJQ29_13140 [Luteolibacter sp.]
MKSILRHLFLVFGCLHLVGGPHSLIQAYAWANMLVDYSSESSISQAVTDTFSGEKPCALCNKISAAKAAESDSEQEPAPLLSASSKLFQDLYPPTIPTLHDPFSTPFPEAIFASPADLISPPTNGPPTPPPRC